MDCGFSMDNNSFQPRNKLILDGLKRTVECSFRALDTFLCENDFGRVKPSNIHLEDP